MPVPTLHLLFYRLPVIAKLISNFLFLLIKAMNHSTSMRTWFLIASIILGFAFPLALQADQLEVLTWRTLAPIPNAIGVAGPFAGISKGRLIVAGGANFPDGPPWKGNQKVWHDTVFLLDLEKGSEAFWSTAKTDLPEPSAYGVSLTIEEGVLCIGGGDAKRHTASVRLMTCDGDQVRFTSLPPLPTPMAFGCGALLGRTVYLAGGRETPDAKETLHSFWKLELGEATQTPKHAGASPAANQRWEKLKPWPGPPRMLAIAGAQDGSFFLFGGVDLEVVENKEGVTDKVRRVPLVDAYRYTPKTGWKQVADLPHPVTAAASPALSLGNVDLAIVGGDSGSAPKDLPQKDHPGFSRELLVYNPITDAWAAMGEIPTELEVKTDGKPDATPLASPVTTTTVPYHDGFIIPSGEMRPGVRTPQVLLAEPRRHEAQFGLIDYLVIVIYLGSLVAMGFYFSRREKTTDDFFLGGKRVPWWAAGLSIYGTQLSAITK